MRVPRRAGRSGARGRERGRDCPRAGVRAHHEDVARLGALPARAEELEQVVELPMNVAADGHRAGDGVHRRLLEHDLLHVLAQVLQIELR